MTDPESEPEPSTELTSQLEVLERYDHQRRTWELELLLSGAIVFALLGLPARLDEWFFSLEVHVSRNQFIVFFFAFYYLKLIAYGLIVSFFGNLVMRAYWVGLVGLHKVFPDGIRWERSKDGPILQEVYRSHPSLPQLIRSADKLSSLIFSSSFIIVIAFVFSIFLVGALSLVAWGISRLPFADGQIQTILYVLLAAVLVPAIVATMIDKALAKKPRESWEGRWYVRPITAILKAFQWLAMRPLYSSIQLTLSTNMSRKLSVPLFILAFVGLIGFFAVSVFLNLFGKLPVHGYRFFPDVRVERSVDYSHYESLRPEGEIFRTAPSIQSDIISDPYVKLFIPYSPYVHNRRLAKLCAGVEPIPQEGFSVDRMRPPAESIDAALDCLASFHLVYLNGERVEPEYDFYNGSGTGVRGIVAYFPTEGLPRGRNALRIERVEVDDAKEKEKEKEKEKDEGEDDEPPVEYFIPFWL